VPEPAVVLIAAHNEADRIGDTVRALRAAFPNAAVVVADDGSHDATAVEAEAAGATVLRLPHRGKGQALTLAEQAAPPGPLLLCDADLHGDLRPLATSSADLTIAAFSRRQGGGFGLVKQIARALIRAATGDELREPLSGQRLLSEGARAACFPVAAGFGVETRMTIDALRRSLTVDEVEIDLVHRATGRNIAGFAHRGRQLVDLLLALGPTATNHRGLRLPLVGAAVALGGLRAPRRTAVAVAAVTAVGLADDLWSGPERGWREHLSSGSSTGIAKAVAIPVAGALATGSLSGGLLVGLSANGLNLLDTRPGRALKTFLVVAGLLRGRRLRPYAWLAVLLTPYDLREMAMLGDAGSNALGAVLGLEAVPRLSGRSRWIAIAALGGLTVLGEIRSLGALIESTPGLREIDHIGRQTS
jgi:hypothetical protein